MGFALIDSFDTIEEANKCKEELIKEGYVEDTLHIFDDKDFIKEVGKRYTVNIG